MLFLGIDQHALQLTVSLRDQNGDVILARQVSTQPEKILGFFDQLARRCARRQADKWLMQAVRVTPGPAASRLLSPAGSVNDLSCC